MFAKSMICSVAILFALASPADALFGGGGGSRGGGGGSKGSSSSKSSSKSGSKSRGGGLSVGASVGGTRAGASIGGGRGISAGASVGGVSAGASVGRSGISAGASVGTTGTSLSTSIGTSGVSISATQGSAATASAAASPPGSLLPWRLLPLTRAGCGTTDECQMLTGRAAARGAPGANTLVSDGNAPAPLVTACQRAAAEAAQAYGALKVEAASAGRVRSTGQGGVIAPVKLRITYALAEGGTQAREAEIGCAISGSGQVVAMR